MQIALRLKTLAILIFVVFGSFISVQAQAARPLALVYRGPGACPHDGCHEAAAAAAFARGFDVEYVSPENITPSIFIGVSLWVQPGGNAITVAKKLGPEKLALIREFVRDGGAYAGFCAGGFLTDVTVNDEETIAGLGIIPVGTYDYPIDSKQFGVPIEVNWHGLRRNMYFYKGPAFKPAHHVDHYYREFAWYPNGAAAGIETVFGRGGVAVTGAHPEAPLTWKNDADYVDPDGSDLYFAEELIDRAMRLSVQ